MHRIFLFLLFAFSLNFSQNHIVMVSGQVTDQKTGMPLPQCNITVQSGSSGAVTDSLGLYVLSLSKGIYHLQFDYTGYQSLRKKIEIGKSVSRLRLNVALIPLIYQGEEVTVFGESAQTDPDVQSIDHIDIKNMPTINADVLRTVKILPGVTSNSELTSAYNVRGGNYDENLIYLDGFEVYRPYLLRSGIEENHSLINRDMVQGLEFYSGGFPAEYGDKMSSVLVVDYQREHEARLHGVAHGNLFNFGLTLNRKTGNLNWAVGGRYANPQIFLSKLQTTGDYRPSFADVQVQLNYRPARHSSFDLLLLYAGNRFDLTPQNWMGNFKFSIYDVKSISIEYDGYRNYNYQTGLLGLRFRHNLSPTSLLSVSLAGYRSRETDDMDLTGDIYYVPDARYPWKDRQYLKSRLEQAANRLDVANYEFKTDLSALISGHHLTAGGEVKWNRLNNRIDEHSMEQGDETLLEAGQAKFRTENADFDQAGFFLQDEFSPAAKIKFNAGLRYLHYQYNGENLFSPRFAVHYFPGGSHNLCFRTGIYYQPPFYYELNIDSEKPLKSQKAAHYILGWLMHPKEKLELQFEIFYKDLNRLIPFYQDQLRLIYTGSNENEGYSAGFDVLLKGELIEGLNSWISYGYMKSRERPIGGGEYRPRLLDQRHTLRLFLQDKIPQYPNVQYHTRILFGSGFLYHPRQTVEDSATGQRYLTIDFQKLERYNFYARVDMGLTARINISKSTDVVFLAEVLNVFNNSNISGYSWFQVFSGSSQPLRIPHVFTRRCFNFGAEFYF